MEPVTKPSTMDMIDFEIINGPDNGPGNDLRSPPQPSKGEVSSPRSRIGTIYIEAQVKPDYTGSLAEVCNHS